MNVYRTYKNSTFKIFDDVDNLQDAKNKIKEYVSSYKDADGISFLIDESFKVSSHIDIDPEEAVFYIRGIDLLKVDTSKLS